MSFLILCTPVLMLPDGLNSLSLIKCEVVTRVDNYKYLGRTINDKLLWKPHDVNKMHSFLYRNLLSFNVHPELMQLFFTSVICNIYLNIFCSHRPAKQQRSLAS